MIAVCSCAKQREFSILSFFFSLLYNTLDPYHLCDAYSIQPVAPPTSLTSPPHPAFLGKHPHTHKACCDYNKQPQSVFCRPCSCVTLLVPLGPSPRPVLVLVLAAVTDVLPTGEGTVFFSCSKATRFFSACSAALTFVVRQLFSKRLFQKNGNERKCRGQDRSPL